MKTEPENQASENETSQALVGKNIIWVEDDNSLNEIMEKWLSRYGSKLRHTTHGQKVLKMIEEELPDIVLIDILLPDINGFEILKQLKEEEKFKDIPVILFSNLSSEADIKRGRELGADRFIVKSTVFLDTLALEIEDVLKERGQL